MSKRIDDPAAPIVEKPVAGNIIRLTTDERSDFARFVLSLRACHPDAVTLAKAEGERTLRSALERDPEEYFAAKAPPSPPTFVDWVEQNVEALYHPALRLTLGDMQMSGALIRWRSHRFAR